MKNINKVFCTIVFMILIVQQGYAEKRISKVIVDSIGIFKVIYEFAYEDDKLIGVTNYIGTINDSLE